MLHYRPIDCGLECCSVAKNVTWIFNQQPVVYLNVIPYIFNESNTFWHISILPHLFRKITDISPDFPVILGLRRNRKTNRKEGETL